MRHRLTLAQQAEHRDVHVPELTRHAGRAAHDCTRFDHAATQTGADDRRDRRSLQRFLPVVRVVGVERRGVAVVAVHDWDAEPSLERGAHVESPPLGQREVGGALRRDHPFS